MNETDRTTITIDSDLAELLEQYGETRNDQVQALLTNSPDNTSTQQTVSATDIQALHDELAQLDERIDNLSEQMATHEDELAQLHETVDKLPDRVALLFR